MHVAGDGDRAREDDAGKHELDVVADGLLGADDGFSSEGGVVASDELGEAATELGVAQEVGTALVVVDETTSNCGPPGTSVLDR